MSGKNLAPSAETVEFFADSRARSAQERRTHQLCDYLGDASFTIWTNRQDSEEGTVSLFCQRTVAPTLQDEAVATVLEDTLRAFGSAIHRCLVGCSTDRERCLVDLRMIRDRLALMSGD